MLLVINLAKVLPLHLLEKTNAPQPRPELFNFRNIVGFFLSVSFYVGQVVSLVSLLLLWLVVPLHIFEVLVITGHVSY